MVNKTKYNLFIILILILLISSTIIYAAYVNQEIIDGGGSGSAKLETDKLNGIEESGVIKLDEELNIGHEGFSSNTSIELDNYIFNDEYLLNDGRGYGPGRYGAYTFYSISRDGFIPRSEEKYYKNRMTYSKLAELQNLNGQTVNSHSLSNYTVYSTGSTSASFNTYEYWIHSSGTTHYGKNSGTYLYRSYPVIEYGMGTKIDLCGDLDREKIALSYFLTSDTTWSQKQEAVSNLKNLAEMD